MLLCSTFRHRTEYPTIPLSLGSVCTSVTICVTMGKSWCLESFGVIWIWAKWLTQGHTARVYISELGRHLFIIFLFLTLGSIFDSVWSLSPQESESETVCPNHLFDATYPRRMISPALFRIYHCGNSGCSCCVNVGGSPCSSGWMGAGSSKIEGQGSEFQLIRTICICQVGVIGWVSMSACNIVLPRLTWGKSLVNRRLFDNLGCSSVGRERERERSGV